MTNTYYIIFIATLISAIIFLIAGIVMFFLFNIPKITGILTGFTARKQIKHIQNRDKSVENNSNHLDTFMDEQRNIAKQVKEYDNTNSQQTYVNQSVKTTASVSQQTGFIQNATETISLETDVLPENSIPASNMPETTYLENETTGNLDDKSENIKFNIIFSLDFINTDEVI
jgi:hypothetical protein